MAAAETGTDDGHDGTFATNDKSYDSTSQHSWRNHVLLFVAIPPVYGLLKSNKNPLLERSVIFFFVK